MCIRDRLANKSVAKILSDNQWFNVYRIHDTPNIDKLNQLVGVCQNFGHDVKIEGEGDELKSSINELLRDIKGTPEENMIETLVTRCMSKATYTIVNTGHYGLGFTHYSHFTSPIRRYPDLITHRILFDYLNKKPNGNPKKIEDMAKWCSSREILAAKAERESIKFKQIEYLEDKIGNVFNRISEVSNSYRIPENASTAFRKLYLNLQEFEDDFQQHVHLENNILFPKTLKLDFKTLNN